MGRPHLAKVEGLGLIPSPMPCLEKLSCLSSRETMVAGGEIDIDENAESDQVSQLRTGGVGSFEDEETFWLEGRGLQLHSVCSIRAHGGEVVGVPEGRSSSQQGLEHIGAEPPPVDRIAGSLSSAAAFPPAVRNFGRVEVIAWDNGCVELMAYAFCDRSLP